MPKQTRKMRAYNKAFANSSLAKDNHFTFQIRRNILYLFKYFDRQRFQFDSYGDAEANHESVISNFINDNYSRTISN